MASIIFPGYFIEKPLFQSIKTLRRLLSEQDSCFHANQVAIAFLEDHIKTSGVDNSKFIADLCNTYSISGGQRNWDVTKRLMSRSYIVQTYNIQEIFFKDFNSEYRDYKKVTEWKNSYKEGSSTKKMDPYSQLIENLPADKANKFRNTPESIAIQYYRLVRNGIVHSSANSLDKPSDFFNKYILPKLEYFKGYYKFLINNTIPAPNPPDKLNHYDFTIYSRCLKNLANLINDSCDLTVAEILEFELLNKQFVKQMKRYNPKIDEGTKEKLLIELHNFFKMKYGNLAKENKIFTESYLRWRE